MKHEEIEPEKRFTNTHFDPRIEFEGQINTSIYKCPKCDTQISFNTNDFQKHAATNFSNLPAKIDSYIYSVRPLDSESWESFLDFSCRGCEMPIRVIFTPWEFAMGCYGFDIASVIEIET